MVFPPESGKYESHCGGDYSNGLLTLMAIIIAMRASGHEQQKRHTPRTRTLAAWRAIMEDVQDTAATDDDSGLGFCDDDDDNRAPRVKRRRRVHPRVDFRASQWAVMLRSGNLGDSTSRDAALFRGWFRVPHVLFLQLVELVEEREWFALAREDVAEGQCIPAELKVKHTLSNIPRAERTTNVDYFNTVLRTNSVVPFKCTWHCGSLVYTYVPGTQYAVRVTV